MIPSLRLALCVCLLPLSSLTLASQDAATHTLKHYEVRDLIADPVAKVQLANAKATPRKDKLPDPATRPVKPMWKVHKADSAQLAQFFARFAEPKLGANEKIAGLKGTLLVTGTPARHKWLSSAIEANRQHARSEHGIAIEFEVIRLSDEVFRTHIHPLLRDKHQIVLSDSASVDLVRKLNAIEGVSPQHVPRFASHTMTTAGITIGGEQTSYIKDFDVEIRTAKAIATPVIGVIRHGVFLQSTVGLLEKDVIGVDLSLVDLHLHRPIPTHKTKFGVGATLKVQLPQTTMTQRRVMLKFSKGQAALVTVSRGKTHLVTIVRAKITEPKRK